MSSNWRSELNHFLAEFDTETTMVLETINEMLIRSGHTFNDKIRRLIEKSVKSRLEQTLEYFDIERVSYVSDNRKCAMKNDPDLEAAGDVQPDSNASSEAMGIVENILKIERVPSDDEATKKVGIVSSTHLGSCAAKDKDEAIQLNSYHQNIYRPSLDSNLFEQPSECSPSTSNLSMMTTTTFSPIQTTHSTPNSKPDMKTEEIKRESEDNLYDAMILKQMEESIAIMSGMQTDPMEMYGNNETPSTSQSNIDSSMSLAESRPLKRHHSDNIPYETTIKQKISDELKLGESHSINRANFPEQNIAFACYHCYSRNNLLFETFNDVYNHWEFDHCEDLPFRLIAFGKAACFYCRKCDIFPKLKDHHRRKHPSEIFIVVNRQDNTKCGLCHNFFSTPTEMMLHFSTQHDPSNYTDIHSPVCFTQSEMEHLLSINSSEKMDHSGQIESIICGYCNKKERNEISFMQHFEQDPLQFMCSTCSILGNSIQEIVQHEVFAHKLPLDPLKHSRGLVNRMEKRYLRTKIKFANGLILFKHNLLNTTLDDRIEFWPIIKRIANQKLNEYNKHSDQTKSMAATENLHREELAKQRSYCRNLRIKGLSQADDADLPKIFLCICKAIGMSDVSMVDVDTIFRRSGAVIVKMAERNVKNKIIEGWRHTHRDIKIKHLQTVMNGPISLFIESELTPFFVKLKNYAEAAKDNFQILSFLMTDDGLKVKAINRSATSIIWSKDELIDFIESKF